MGENLHELDHALRDKTGEAAGEAFQAAVCLPEPFADGDGLKAARLALAARYAAAGLAVMRLEHMPRKRPCREEVLR